MSALGRSESIRSEAAPRGKRPRLATAGAIGAGLCAVTIAGLPPTPHHQQLAQAITLPAAALVASSEQPPEQTGWALQPMGSTAPASGPASGTSPKATAPKPPAPAPA